MRTLILKLTLGAVVLGLVAVMPSRARAQNPMFMATATRFGACSRVNIFAPPIVRLSVNPAGPQFGFNLQALFAPSMRARFSPFGQGVVFRSDSSSTFGFTPGVGATAQVNTPALFGVVITPTAGVQQFAFPSRTILSSAAGTTVSTSNGVIMSAATFNALRANGLAASGGGVTSLSAADRALWMKLMGLSNTSLIVPAPGGGFWHINPAWFSVPMGDHNVTDFGVRGPASLQSAIPANLIMR
jgi:hypothetical protein